MSLGQRVLQRDGVCVLELRVVEEARVGRVDSLREVHVPAVGQDKANQMELSKGEKGSKATC